jgi:hypothetical protein
MLQRRWNSKRDPRKRREILAFLATPEAQGMGDREVARRFLVHHQLVARLRAKSTPVRVDDSKSRSTTYSDPIEVDDSRQRPSLEVLPGDFQFVEVHLHDECPGIGSGWRRVIVVSQAATEVTILRPHGTRRQVQLDRAVFDRCRPRVLTPGYDYDPARIRRLVRENAPPKQPAKAKAESKGAFLSGHVDADAAGLTGRGAAAATKAWIASFATVPEAPLAPLSPSVQAYIDELAKLPRGVMPDLPDFLDRRKWR